jgi:hypothetical protein
VWAKPSKHVHWPARISGVLNDKSVKVEFFPDETAGFAEVHPSQIVLWVGGYEKYSKLEQSDPEFRRAIEAATIAWNEESHDLLLI